MAGIRISPDVLSSAEHVGVLQAVCPVGVMQAAWPVIAERFPSLSEEDDLFVEDRIVEDRMYVIHFVRLPEDWGFSILHLNDEATARVRQTLDGHLQLPCWMDPNPIQAGLG